MNRTADGMKMIVLAAFVGGCATHQIDYGSLPASVSKADVALDRYASLPACSDDTELIVALSGGGSRAAVFAAEFLLALDQMPCRVRHNVTLVTSVSGGSITAALYASSFDSQLDTPPGRLLWTPLTVRPLVRHSIEYDLLRELANPRNALGYLVGTYTRTDALQATVQRLLAGYGHELLTYGDLNPRRPQTIIGATVASDGESQLAFPFGGLFAFDRETFTVLESDWDLAYLDPASDYEGPGPLAFKAFPVARAVAASAAFPAVFDYVTLPYPRRSPASSGGVRFIHLFDGGNFDNLGLFAVKRALLQQRGKFLSGPKKLVIISVDAGGAAGASELDDAPRSIVDRAGVQLTTLFTSFDALLLSKRDRILGEFREGRFQAPEDRVDCLRQGLGEICFDEDFDWQQVNALLKQKLLFIHFHFHSPETQYVGRASDNQFRCSHSDLIRRVDHIPTRLTITDEEAEDLTLLNALFMGEWNPCFGNVLAALGVGQQSSWRESSLGRYQLEARFAWMYPKQQLPSCELPRPDRFVTLSNGQRIDTRMANEVRIGGRLFGSLTHATRTMQGAIAKAELEANCPSISPQAGRDILWSAVTQGRERPLASTAPTVPTSVSPSDRRTATEERALGEGTVSQ